MNLSDYISKHQKEHPEWTNPVAEPGPVDDLVDSPASAPTPAVTTPKNDYATTTATTPEQGAAERQRKASEAADTASSFESLGYGAARGATLGAVDRLVGLGTAIGERAAEASGAARTTEHPYERARLDYLTGEQKAAEAHPVLNVVGDVIGGSIPAAITGGVGLASRLPEAGKLVQTSARVADAATLGGVAGALNTREDDAATMATGAAKGAALGVGAEATLGTAARNAIRGAPAREENASLRDVMESEAGRVTATTAKKTARDIDDVRDILKNDPEMRAANREPADKAAAFAQTRASELGAPQPERYAIVDKTLESDPLTATSLLKKLVDKERSLPDKNLPLMKKALLAVRDSIRNDFAPKWAGQDTWTGERVPISMQQLRGWVTSVQGTADAAMGTINGTSAAVVPGEIAKLCNEILEERLDRAASAGGDVVKGVVADIRESDRQVSAYLALKRAAEDRKWRELSQSIGYTKRAADVQQAQANMAAGGLAVSGNVPAALAVAGAGPAKRVAREAARTINDRMLAPLQRAVQAGSTWAEVARMSAELGVPSGIARTLYERNQKTLPTVTPPVLAPVPSVALPPQPVQPHTIPYIPPEYRTTTRTQ